MFHRLKNEKGMAVIEFVLISALIAIILSFGTPMVKMMISDGVEGMFDFGEIAFLNPTILLSFISIFFGTSFLFETRTEFHLVIVCLLSGVIALIIVSLLHIFVLVPIKNAEQSTAFSMNDLVGKIGELTVPVPENGFGQISLNEKLGYLSYPAKSRDGEAIENGQEVRIIGIEDGECVVKIHHARINKK